jgi:hypothetical protein
MFFVPERRRSRRRLSAIRARDVRAADLQEKPTKRVRLEMIFRDSRFGGFDKDGGSQANIAASGASHRTQRAPASEAISTALLCLACALGSTWAIWSDPMIRVGSFG